jgi:hypothetical protein
MHNYEERLRRWEFTALTAEDISSLPDEELDDWLSIRMSLVVGVPSAAAVAALPEARRAYYATRMFEWDVMNGGLHQYLFNNPDPDLLDLVVEGYRSLDLESQATVVLEIVAPLAAREAEWRESLRDGTVQTFMESYVESALPDFDDRIETHDADRLDFVRSHAQIFAI